MANKKTRKQTPPLVVSIDEDLRKRLQQSAGEHDRSMSGEVRQAIRAWVNAPDPDEEKAAA